MNEALFAFLILTQVRRQKFQRDEPVESGIQRFVDHTHATGAELFEDFVMRYGFADHYEVEVFT